MVVIQSDAVGVVIAWRDMPLAHTGFAITVGRPSAIRKFKITRRHMSEIKCVRLYRRPATKKHGDHTQYGA
ncbi:hypothetical protein ABI_00900 [Asticcacaulis biprosthecium C19]|uniref:Uncharacterized protein n=1 Tax=Asticcacaulis biprosthecium C19 TaxID=715226 RepID=F4QG47_9CAUL|nr:hypothetical protein ABI_00900 [Asticcacaulis biprosthecium C19]